MATPTSPSTAAALLAGMSICAASWPGHAQTPPAAPVILSASQSVPLPLTLPAGTAARTEVAPPLLAGPGGTRLIYLPTTYTYLCETSGNPLQAPVVLAASDCAWVDVPANQASPRQYLAPAAVPAIVHQWKLEYDAVFSAQITHDSATNTDLILTVNHNEVKNEVVPRYYNYQSPFAPPASELPASCGYSGYTGRGPRGFLTCWQAYGAFVSVEVNELSARTNYGRVPNQSEIGPVVWPSAGYFDLSRGAAGKLSSGLRHPSSIIANGYIYIYYFDTSKGVIGGLSVLGTKVARAAISPKGIPGSFLAWDGHAFAVPALPAGFDKNNLAASIARPGPQVASLFAAEAAQRQGYSLQSTHFSVAYDPRRHLYIGVEQFIDYGDGNGNGASHRIALRFSSDLVHWSARTLLGFNGSQMSYAEFANAAFTSNNEVDLGNLFLVGTDSGRVMYAHLSVR